jgi:hypothetical protein
MQIGDVIFLHYMPYPIADRLIYRVSNSHCDHVAICLPDAETLGPAVYEAQPPRARMMSVAAYEHQISTWATKRAHWRRRTGNQLKVELLRSTVPDLSLFRMVTEANRWMGVRYSMVINWLFRTRNIHCSELVARCLVTGDVAREWDCELSRTTPIMVREKLIERGWQVVSYPE